MEKSQHDDVLSPAPIWASTKTSGSASRWSRCFVRRPACLGSDRNTAVTSGLEEGKQTAGWICCRWSGSGACALRHTTNGGSPQLWLWARSVKCWWAVSPLGVHWPGDVTGAQEVVARVINDVVIDIVHSWCLATLVPCWLWCVATYQWHISDLACTAASIIYNTVVCLNFWHFVDIKMLYLAKYFGKVTASLLDKDFHQ